MPNVSRDGIIRISNTHIEYQSNREIHQKITQRSKDIDNSGQKSNDVDSLFESIEDAIVALYTRFFIVMDQLAITLIFIPAPHTKTTFRRIVRR